MIKPYKNMLKYLLTFAAAIGIMASAQAEDRITHNPNTVNDDIIFHAWSWSFPSMTKHMKQIADAGYTIIQTSPVQNCFCPEGTSMRIWGKREDNGNYEGWWFYYQPLDWKVGNHVLGNKEQMQVMLDEAKKYGLRVIVDVLPNHTSFSTDSVSPEYYKAVGGRKKMFHTKGLTPVKNYSDRYQCTLQGCGGLPDVNTENPKMQAYYMNFVNELLAMGVRGFRYDTAKHIGVHSDPTDKEAGVKVNDFWDVATGRKAVRGVKLALPMDSLFVYGEVLQDRGVPEKEYADYFGMTASGYGWNLCKALEKHSAKGIDLVSWHHNVAPEYLATWVESHDTYCNANETAGIPDEMIRCGWVWLTARQNGIPLFYNRPAGSTRQNYWGNNVLGEAGNDEYFHPEVVAVNQFRHNMAGQLEDLQMSDTQEVLVVNRGNKGAAIINLATKARALDIKTSLPDGEYFDKVYNQPFVVEGGHLKGALKGTTTYILYSK